jgi:hypothetical protein
MNAREKPRGRRGVGIDETRDMVRVEKDGFQIKTRLPGKDQSFLSTCCWNLKK